MHRAAQQEAEDRRIFGKPPEWWTFWFTVALIVSNGFLWLATQNNATAAKRAAKIAERALVELETPFVFPVISSNDVAIGLVDSMYLPSGQQDNRRPGVGFRLKNFGRTPALLRSIGFSFEHLTEMHRQIRVDVYQENVIDAILGQVDQTTKEFTKTVALSDEASKSVRDMDSWLFLYGEVIYADLFKNLWKQTFCFAWHPKDEGFVPWGAANNVRTAVAPDSKK